MWKESKIFVLLLIARQIVAAIDSKESLSRLTEECISTLGEIGVHNKVALCLVRAYVGRSLNKEADSLAEMELQD